MEKGLRIRMEVGRTQLGGIREMHVRDHGSPGKYVGSGEGER